MERPANQSGIAKSAILIHDSRMAARSKKEIIFDTVARRTVTINALQAFPPHRGPRRLAWPRTSPFHGGNTGSNPVGDANLINNLRKRLFWRTTGYATV